MKNSNDTIGNCIHNLPACSAVPQPPSLFYFAVLQQYELICTKNGAREYVVSCLHRVSWHGVVRVKRKEATFTELPYYLGLKTHNFSRFSELKIRVRLKLDILFFTLRKCRKHDFPRRTSDLAKRGL
jgi:hypothetical protein